MSDVTYCSDHGYQREDPCQCSGAEVLMSESEEVQLSKFLSGALRHFPGDVGLEITQHGWVDADAVVEAVSDKYNWVTRRHIAAVVSLDAKGRYEARGSELRAVYGHSIDVTINTGTSDESAIPDPLFHGTPEENLDAIRREGLRPMSRQAVHLTDDPSEAHGVGERHGTNIAVLAVDVPGLVAAGHEIEQRGDSVYTTDAVPPEYLSQ